MQPTSCCSSSSIPWQNGRNIRQGNVTLDDKNKTKQRLKHPTCYNFREKNSNFDNKRLVESDNYGSEFPYRGVFFQSSKNSTSVKATNAHDTRSRNRRQFLERVSRA